jgi:hypothetical protein
VLHDDQQGLREWIAESLKEGGGAVHRWIGFTQEGWRGGTQVDCGPGQSTTITRRSLVRAPWQNPKMGSGLGCHLAPAEPPFLKAGYPQMVLPHDLDNWHPMLSSSLAREIGRCSVQKLDTRLVTLS